MTSWTSSSPLSRSTAPAADTTVNISVVTDREDCMAALDLLADLLLHPAFDSNEFSKLVIGEQSDLDASRTIPVCRHHDAPAKDVALSQRSSIVSGNGR